MYFYSDTEIRAPFLGFKEPPDANTLWLRHYRNYVELSWMAASPLLSHLERRQVEKELRICQKKMDYWYKKRDWNMATCSVHIERIKREWQFNPKFPHNV